MTWTTAPSTHALRSLRRARRKGYSLAAFFLAAFFAVASSRSGLGVARAHAQGTGTLARVAQAAAEKVPPSDKANPSGKAAPGGEDGDDDDDDDEGPSADKGAPPATGPAVPARPAGKDRSADNGDDDDDDDANRFPQPVRVGDLIGRAVIAPQESQNLIGYIRKVVAAGDDVSVVITIGGYFGFGTHLVCVSIDDLALTGYAVQAKEIDASELARLPVCDGSAGRPLEANATIKVNLAKPAH